MPSRILKPSLALLERAEFERCAVCKELVKAKWPACESFAASFCVLCDEIEADKGPFAFDAKMNARITAAAYPPMARGC